MNTELCQALSKLAWDMGEAYGFIAGIGVAFFLWLFLKPTAEKK